MLNKQPRSYPEWPLSPVTILSASEGTWSDMADVNVFTVTAVLAPVIEYTEPPMCVLHLKGGWVD